MWITNVAVRRRVTMLMIIGGVMLLGLTRIQVMPLEYFPKIDIPVVTVATVYAGAGPDEIEQRVTKPIEDAVAIVNGVDELSSTSQENMSVVVIQFQMEVDVDVAAADVRDAVAQARAVFPDDVDDPVVRKIDISAMPIVRLGVSGSRSPKDLLTFVDEQVKPRFGQVNGVSSVTVTGGETREIRVEGHADRLEAVGLSISQLAQLVAAENLDVPAGELKEGSRGFSVRAKGQFEDLEEIRRLRLATPLGGTVYLSEVADVSDSVEDADTVTRLNGKPTVGINILKQTDANTVSVSVGVHRAIEEMKRDLPKDIDFLVYYDSADDTREAVRDVLESLILGALLASLVTYLFLHNVRAMIIVVLAIPTSMICTFLPIYAFGFTINMMTLLALSLSVGILVDDSIVIIENIERHQKIGEDPAVAAVNGRSEIGGAAVAITLVDVVVFVPVAFMGGIVGRIFLAFGITVAVATLFSLFMSFTLTPMLASWWFRRETADERARAERHWTRHLNAALAWPLDVLERAYRAFLPAPLRHPYLAVVIGYAALALIVMGVVKSGRVPFEFMPSEDTGQCEVLVESVPGTRIEVTDAIVAQIEKRLLDKARYPEVRDLGAAAGTQGSAFAGAGNSGGQYGALNVILRNGTERRKQGLRNDTEFVSDLRADLADIPSVDINVVPSGGHMGGSETDIELLLQGPNYDALSRAAQEITQRLRTLPGILYPKASAKPGRPEVRVRVNRARAADLGVTAAQIAGAVRAAYEGDTSSKYRVEGDEYNLRVLLREFDRTRLDDVADLFVGLANTGQRVRVRDVADVFLTTGPSRIERQDRSRCVTVTAYFAKGVRGSEGEAEVAKAIGELQDQGRLAGMTWRFAGQTERRTENFGYMGQSLLLAVLLVYVVTAALYSNILQPLNVMLTLPMAFGGGLLALFLTGASVSISSIIGMIMLVGIVGKNSILVVDYANTLKARGKNTFEALLEAGPTRMRPILMTTIACVMGMLPTALALNEGAAFRRPMAVVVIGGLLLSTLLSLLIVPSFYMITDHLEERYYDLGRRLARLFRRKAEDES